MSTVVFVNSLDGGTVGNSSSFTLYFCCLKTTMWHYKSCGCILWTVLTLGLCFTGISKRTAIPSSSLDVNEDLDLESRSRIQRTNASKIANALTLRKFSQETSCTESEYASEYMCNGAGRPMTYRCIQRFESTKMNYIDAQATCENRNMQLLKLSDYTDKIEHELYYLRDGQGWLGLYKDNDNVFRWLIDATEPTWSEWESIQPDNTGRCVEFRPTGWNDNYCSERRYFSCSHYHESDTARDYRVKPLEINIIPSGAPYWSGDYDVTVNCIAYLYRFETLSILIDFEFDSPQAYHPNEICNGWQGCSRKLEHTYFRNHNNVCVRKTIFEVKVPMADKIDGAKFQCRVWNHTGFADSAWERGPLFPQSDHKPVIFASIDPKGIGMGVQLQWTCSYVLGTKEVVSMALISHYNCGDYILTVNVITGEEVQLMTTYACLSIVKVEITPRTLTDKHYRVDITAHSKITGDFEGAYIGCFSFNASGLMAKRNYVQTSIDRAFTEPIKVIGYSPRMLLLEVNYHAEPPLVYSNYRLTALCDANVGEGGSLLWTLRTHGGDSQYASDYNEKNPDISVYSHPSGSSSCPQGWIRNPALETCVKILDEPYSWEESRRQCQSIGSDLVRVFSPHGLNFLFGILGEDGYWIGLHDMDEDGKFTWWSNDANEDTLDLYSWVTLEVREKKALVPNCVFMHYNKWYTHGCFRTLKPVCETQPQHGIPLDAGFAALFVGAKMRSAFTIKINKSLEKATLGCEIVHPTLSDDHAFRDESKPFSVIYAASDPRHVTRWEMRENNLIAHIECSALVGTDGSLSIAVFSEMKIKYLYVVDLNKTIDKVKPAPDFSLTKLTVTNSKLVGAEIALEATLSTTEELKTPFAMCYSHRTKLDEAFTFEANIVEAQNKEYISPQYNVGALLATGLLLLLIIVAVKTLTKEKTKAIGMDPVGSTTTDQSAVQTQSQSEGEH